MSKLLAYVGRNFVAGFKGGGIDIFEISRDGKTITPLEGGIPEWPKRAGFLDYAPKKGVLYAVDERKTDGRGPKQAPATIMAFKADQKTGALSLINKVEAIGCNPASLCVGPDEKYVFVISHGFFEHVIKAVETADGKWANSFVYDDSTVVQYPVNADGSLEPACDCHVLTGHGRDPNDSPQGGGHAQASPHGHIVVVDPSGKFLIACEKAGERIYVYRLGEDRLVLASIYQAPLGTGPRHAAFDKKGRMFMTCEFSSEIWSFDFDTETGVLKYIDKQSTIAPGFTKRNELATVQVHPNGKFVYVNNRGEDTIVCFKIAEDGKLTKVASTPAGACEADPRDAVRDMQLSPDGAFLLVPVRPDDVLRSYAVDPNDGSLTVLTEMPVENPVYIQFVEL